MDSLRKDMEMEFEKFLGATKKFAVVWAENKVRSTIRSHAELAKSYGRERVGKLKLELNQLIEMMPRIVENHVNVDKYWAHRGKVPDEFLNNIGRYRISGNRLPGDLNDALREVFGNVGILLIDHNFDTAEGSEWEIEHRGGRQVCKFKYGYDCSDEMKTILGRYSENHKQFIELNRELKETKKEKSEAEAMDLWDKA